MDGGLEAVLEQEVRARSAAGLAAQLEAAFVRWSALPALEGEGAALSYAELDRRTRAWAAWLSTEGVKPGDIVALLMRRSVDLVCAQLALVRLGAVYAPIDIGSPPRRIADMLDALPGALGLSDGSVEPPPGRQRWLRPPEDQDRASPATVGTAAATRGGSCDLAYVMFTSGSTGTPKGVLVPQGGVVRLVCGADHAEFREGARWAFLSSPAFDASTLEVWGPLLNGGCCVVMEQATPALDEMAAFLVQRRITDAWLTAALFNVLVEDHLDALGGLSQLLTGGERLSPHHVARMIARHPSVQLINGYGPTENTTFSLCHRIAPGDAQSEAGIPIGRPIRGTEARVQPQDGRPGDEGELWVAGLGVARGYLNDPGLTAGRFVVVDGRRWYRTGDRVRRRADGVFEYLGRIDRQVKLQGHRVELDEVELCLAECPGVGDVAVMVRGDSPHTQHLAACYAGVAGAPPDPAAVQRHLAQRLPPPAVPRLLVPCERLPITLNGKVDRAAAQALLEAAVPAPARAWGSELEQRLAEVWAAQLGLAVPGPDADFLQLGGTSLAALRVSAAVRRQLGAELPPLDILRFPILAEQAARLRPLHPADPIAAPADSAVRLTHAQQLLLEAAALDPTASAYLVHVALLAGTEIAPETMRDGFEALWKRHPQLRLAPGAAGARLLDALPAGWWTFHENVLAQRPQDMQMPAAVHEVINRPLALERDGPMRVDAWRLVDGGVLYVWTIHHVVVDEASIDRALDELDRWLAGQTLPPVHGSAFGFPALERAWHDAPGLRDTAARLAAALAGATRPLEAAPAPGREVPLSVPEDLAMRLHAACQRWGCTPPTPLLAAFGRAVAEVFGGGFRFVGTPFSRRCEPQLLEPFGYWVDLRLVEAGAREGEDLPSQLARLHQELLRAQAPAFQPVDALIDETARQDVAAARCVGLFQFTWRQQPARRVPLGAASAQLLRVPQRAARAGLTLHAARVGDRLACTVEAVEGAFSAGVVDRVAAAFTRWLAALVAVPHWACGPSEPPAGGAPLPPPGGARLPDDDAALRAAWQQVLGRAPQGDDDDFLRSGGTSLAAMRLAAYLRRDARRRLDVGAFLARPNFAALRRLAVADDTSGELLTVIGEDRPRKLLLLPGQGGHPVGMHALAAQLRPRLPPDTAVAIVDTDALLARVEAAGRPLLSAFVQELADLVQRIGAAQVAGLAGFSLGGLLALHVAARRRGERLPLWLIDTYCLRAQRPTLRRRLERRLAWWLFGKARHAPAGGQAPQSAAGRHGERQDEALASLHEGRWQALARLLEAEPVPAAAHADVVLIQAEETVRHVGLLWRRRSNGFARRRFGSLTVRRVPAGHLDLLGGAVAQTVRVIGEGSRAAPTGTSKE